MRLKDGNKNAVEALNSLSGVRLGKIFLLHYKKQGNPNLLMEFNNFTKSSFNRFNKYEIGTIPMLNKNCEDLLKYFHIEYFREPILGLMYYLTI